MGGAAPALCTSGQRGISSGRTLTTMQLQQIKKAFGVAWVLAAVLIGIVAVRSTGGLVVLAALGLLPPIALMFLWNEPSETMSESIRGGRR